MSQIRKKLHQTTSGSALFAFLQTSILRNLELRRGEKRKET